jgi:hypothetical protein
LQFGAGDERGLVEVLRVESDRADVVLAACGGISLHEVGQPWAAFARDADRDALEGQADGFLGEEHEGGPPGFGCANGDEEGNGDLLCPRVRRSS